MKHVEFYRNDKDGSVLVSVGTQVPEKLIYAGQELTHLVADTVDAAKEKHVPAIQKIDGHLEVHVGSVTHPMEEKHYIEWIALVDDNGVDIRYLKPGEEPKAEFEIRTARPVPDRNVPRGEIPDHHRNQKRRNPPRPALQQNPVLLAHRVKTADSARNDHTDAIRINHFAAA